MSPILHDDTPISLRYVLATDRPLNSYLSVTAGFYVAYKAGKIEPAEAIRRV